MKNKIPSRTVIELPAEQFNELITKIDRLTDNIESLLNSPRYAIEQEEIITGKEFADTVNIGKTTLGRLINGTHTSGFKLKTFKKSGTKTVWTLASEIRRYFEGFGYYRRPEGSVSEKSYKTRPSKAVVNQCKEIIARIDDHMPGTYAEEAQRILKVRGLNYSIREIHDTRAGRLRNLSILLVLEKLADFPDDDMPTANDLGLAGLQ